MHNLTRQLRPREQTVLSLSVLAATATSERKRSSFEVLVQHLLERFTFNELMATEEETKRAMQFVYMAALPGVLVALYLFPSYHAVPVRRTFWPQAGDHYFYVTYSLVVMGIVALCEWDMMFPDLLDVFVLASLPIPSHKLFLARVVAITSFLGLVLIGTNCLGTFFLPMVADLPSLWRHLIAHSAAVIASGTFSVSLFLAVQGLMLNILGANLSRRIVPFLQGFSIAVLLTLLFLVPLISQSLQGILSSDAEFVRTFPPFWFLGIYEEILRGSTTLPLFSDLARTGWWATVAALTLAYSCYPLAYRRRVRQIVEGPGAADTEWWMWLPLGKLLRAIVVRQPAERAIFFFITQTLLRSRRHRVILATYGGVGIALAIAGSMLLRLGWRHVGVALSADGIRSAIPVFVFWTVAGLRAGLTAPVDRRSSWVFRVILGQPSLRHLEGSKIWVALCSLAVSLAAVFLLRGAAASRNPLATLAQIVVAAGCSLLLTDIQFLTVLALPFTELRKTSITDFPLSVLQYCVVFPGLVLAVVHCETWLEAAYTHLALASLLVLSAHGMVRWIYLRRVSEMRIGGDFGESDDVFQRLGLSD